jgi:hypothetical protein
LNLSRKKLSRNYSLYAEDIIISKFCPESYGIYIDIGNYRLRTNSNTYFFYRRGWKGYIISSQSTLKARFFRRRDIHINVNCKDLNTFDFLGPVISPFVPSFIDLNDSIFQHEVLSNWPWNRFTPRVICVDNYLVGKENLLRLDGLLRENGYIIQSRSLVKMIYVHTQYLSSI